jgi:hypothetical protein
MKKQLMLILVLLATLAWERTGRCDDSAKEPHPAGSFQVLDNLHYAKKPDLTADGVPNCNIVYEGYIWKGGSKSPDFGSMPDETAYKKAVKDHSVKPGPIVIDIETLRLSGKPDVVEPHFKLFTTLVKWTHESAPGRLVGFYGHGLFPEQPGKEYQTQAKALADAVDAFFPSMYTFNDDRPTWAAKARKLVADAHAIAPGKPVLFYIWPQYHEGSPRALELLDGDHWEFELKTAQESGADGVVLWSSGKPEWSDNAPWWVSTQKFLKTVGK